MAVPADSVAPAEKHCSRCDRRLPRSSFGPSKKTKDGLYGWCRACSREYANARYCAQPPDSRTARLQKRKLHYENNRESVLAQQRQYVATHYDEVSSYKGRWASEDRKANPEKHLERKRAYRLANPEKINEQYHRRRARKEQNGSFSVTAKETRRIYASPCLYCGSTKQITLDHVIPISRGGTHSIGNLVPACGSCNSSKGTRFITEWKKFKTS